MRSRSDRRLATSSSLIVSAEPKRPDRQARSDRRDMRLLEDLRKLRRDRAERALNDARCAVAAAAAQVAMQREVVQGLGHQYGQQQDAIGAAIDGGQRSLQEISLLLARTDRARSAVFSGQRTVDALAREQASKEKSANEASRQTRVAAAAHEKVLEWKKSV
jgi:hypothetical protein